MKLIWFLIILLVVAYVVWPRSGYAPQGKTCSLDQSYINSMFTLSDTVTTEYKFSISIPYNEIMSNSLTVGVPYPYSVAPVNKWDAIIKGGLANAISFLPGMSYITPINFSTPQYSVDINGGTIVKISIYDTDHTGVGNQTAVQFLTFASLFAPNAGDQDIMKYSAPFVAGTASFVGCPELGCSTTGLDPGVICQPKIGCKDNGILSGQLSAFITPRLCTTYYKSAPDVSTPLT